MERCRRRRRRQEGIRRVIDGAIIRDEKRRFMVRWMRSKVLRVHPWRSCRSLTQRDGVSALPETSDGSDERENER